MDKWIQKSSRKYNKYPDIGCIFTPIINYKKGLLRKQSQENQHGGVGRHTAPPRTTRPDRKSKGKDIQHQVDKKETFTQTSRRGRDGQLGQRGLAWGQDWRSVGRTGQAVWPLADPAAPHSRTDKPRGPDSEWWRAGQAEWRVASRGSTFLHG